MLWKIARSERRSGNQEIFKKKILRFVKAGSSSEHEKIGSSFEKLET